jgi:hypothetical protein
VTVKREGRKLPCLDTLALFDRHVFPDRILIDGRHDTVNAVCAHPASRLYEAAFAYGLSKEFTVRRHTVFRKVAGDAP